MIDLRAASLVDFLPESLAAEVDVVALSLALDPELQAVAAALVEAVIWPNIDNLPEWVLNELAWSMRFDELQQWDEATLAGKKALLHGVFAWRKKSGTKYALGRIFALLQVEGRIIEWFEEGGQPFTYRMRVTVTPTSPGISLHQLQQFPEWIERFGRTSTGMSELSVEADSTAPLDLYPVLTVGRLVEIGFGG